MTRLGYILIFFICWAGIPVKGQLISEPFTKSDFSDSFDSDNGNWKIMSNADNLFLIQEGKYILQRKNSKSAYSVFPKWENTESAFELNASITVTSTEGPESGAGLIFMAQSDGSGAFLLEINALKQYRLKQLVGLNFRLLTGNIKTNGWVDSQFLNGKNQTNFFQIRTSNRNYDIYINQNYIFSFTELAYKTGNIGISAGPSCQFSVDQISVLGIGSKIDEIGANSGVIQNQGLSTPADSGIILMEELQQLRLENRLLRDSLKFLKTDKQNSKSKSTKTDTNSQKPLKHPE